MKATLEEHKERLPKALAKVWDIHGIMLRYKDASKIPENECPLADPACIFSITDYGVTLFISRENHNGKVVLLRVSSVVLDVDVLRNFIRNRVGHLILTFTDVIESVEWIVQKLFGYSTLLIEVSPVTLSSAGMPIWIYSDVGNAL